MRPTAHPAPQAEATGPIRGWVRFWFTPTDPVGLHTVRLLAGLVFLAWLAPLGGQLVNFYGLNGWFDRQAYAETARLLAEAEAGRPPEGPLPGIGWSALYLAGANNTLLYGLYALSLVAVILFTLGVWPRLTGVLTWVVVASFAANPVLEGDANGLVLLLAFYLMIGYLLLGQYEPARSLGYRLLGPGDTWLLGRSRGAEPRPSIGANLALRLMQVHMAIVVVTSGLHKLQFGDWWSGVALWYPLYPPLETTLAQARTHARHGEFYIGVLSLLAYLGLAWQIGFPLFAWRPGWRLVLVGGAALGWLVTGLVYHVPVFGPAYFVACLSFVTAGEWQRLLGRLSHLPGLHSLAGFEPATPAPSDAGTRREGAEPVVALGHR